MARFTPQKFDLNDINGGERFEDGQKPEQDAFNAPIEGSAYAIAKAEDAIAKTEDAIAKADLALNSIIPSGGTYPPLTAYPIGSIYMSVNNTSPAELFGGSWVEIKDKFLVGAGNLYALGTTGGSANAVVVEHSHPQLATADGGGWAYPQVYRVGSYSDVAGGVATTGTLYNDTETGGRVNTEIVGEDGTNKNLPPYLAVNIWRRVS